MVKEEYSALAQQDLETRAEPSAKTLWKKWDVSQNKVGIQ